MSDRGISSSHMPFSETEVGALVDLQVPVTAQDHIQGPDTAPVTLVEYGDYECPYCRRAYHAIKWVQREMGDQLRFVYRNFPLREIHPHAQHAAEAAEAAAAQGKFWEMHDALFEHQQALDDDHLRRYAARVGLNTGRFEQDIAQRRYAERIERDLQGGIESGVPGTPTFFVNGLRHEDSYDRLSLLDAVQEAAGPRGGQS